MAEGDGISGLGRFGGYDQARVSLATQAAERAGRTALQAARGKNREAEIEKAATQFEALLVQQMLKEMWQTVPEGGLLDGGSELGYYRDMFNEAVADKIAGQQGIGIKAIIGEDLRRMEKK